MKKKLILGLLASLLLSACQPVSSPSISVPPTGSIALPPYHTVTPQPKPSLSAEAATSTPLPEPSPTPRTHVLSNSDTLLGLAWYYGVSLDAILAANPGINPNALTVGKTIFIPAAPQSTAQAALSPTPVPLESGELNCSSERDGGVWCFWPVSNVQAQPVENVIGQILLSDSEAKTVLSQSAFSPLNRILPGQTIALSAYFPAPVPQPFQASAILKTVLPASIDDARYLPVQIEAAQTIIDNAYLSATVSGSVKLTGSRAASQVWVALIAYDSSGKVVGVRRWESNQPLAAGETLPFEAHVYSIGASIQRVAVMAEAQP